MDVLQLGRQDNSSSTAYHGEVGIPLAVIKLT